MFNLCKEKIINYVIIVIIVGVGSVTFFIIIFLIILMIENSNLRKENSELKRKLGIEGQVINTSVNNNINEVKQNVSPNTVNNVNVNNSVPKSVDNKQSNSASLFIVGAILIVLASLIFIGSTWDLIPGLIKTIILIMFQLFFNLMSNVCRDKYKLEKTSNLFFYLVLIFVPIITLSLALFNVVGPYLSVGGEGFLLYVAITFLISDFIYKCVQTDRKIIKKFGVVSEILAIVYLLVYLKFEFINMMFVLAIYNVIVFILLHGNYLKKEDYKVINDILFYGNLIILVFSISGDNVFSNLGLLLYSFLCFGRLFVKNDERILNLILGTICYSFGLELICDLVSINYYFIYLIMMLPLFSLSFILNNKEKDTLCYMVSIISSLFIAINQFEMDRNYLWCLSYLLLSINYVVSFVLSQKHLLKYLSYLGICVLFGMLFEVYDMLNYTRYIPLVFVVLIYGLEYLVSSLKDKASNKVLMMTLIIEALIFMRSYSVLIPLGLMLVFVYLEKEKEWWLFVPILCSLSVFYIINSEVNSLIFLLAIVLLSLISMLRKEVNVYSITSLVAIFMSVPIIRYDSMLFSVLVFIWGVCHIIVNSKNRNKLYKFVTALSALSLYVCLLNDLEVGLTSIYSLGYFVTLIYLTRYVIDDDSVRGVIEALGFLMIASSCLIMMKSEIDGFIEVFILFMIAIISYKKYQPCFVISVIFIIIYVLIETAEFLFMIPWYVYVLGIGFAFILMGTNEEKKKKENLDNKVVNGEKVNSDSSKVNELGIELPIVKDAEKIEKNK